MPLPHITPKHFLVGSAVALGIAAFIGIVIFFATRESELVEVPGLPREQWDRNLQENADNGTVKLTNAHDGYSIEVPRDWDIPETVDGVGGLKLTYHPDGSFRNDIDFQYGLWLSVDVQSKDPGVDLESWIWDTFERAQISNASINSYQAKKISRPVVEYNDFLELVPVENSSFQRLFIEQGGRVFVLTCSARGPNYSSYVEACNERFESFTILQ